MRLLWRIFIPFFASTLLALAVTTWYANRSLRRFYQEQVAEELLMKAGLLAGDLESRIMERGGEEVDGHCKEFGRAARTRVTVMLPDGSVMGDSDQAPSNMENHRNRPEFSEALAGRTGNSVRFSDTLRRTMMYLAVPVKKDGAVAAVVRVSMPLSLIDWTLRTWYRNVAFGGLVVAVFFAAVAFCLARRISRPINDIRRTAERLAHGDLRARAALSVDEEMQSLARTLNQMAAQLGERMETITRQSDEQKAVFSSMVEGVLVVDGDERIMEMNPAAARLLDADPDRLRGRSIQEAVRNPDMQKFISAALADGGPKEAEIVLYGNEERFLQMRGTALADPAGGKPGVLVVLNDITRVKRLETMRRDFIANVSHELKTPITAIKGCAETLSDKARRDPGEDGRFLAMMARQAERLSAIVEDLLSLSRLDHDAEHKRIQLEPGPVCEVLRRAAQAFTRAADAKKIKVAVDCPGGLSAPINAPLLEQAVGNLIDNAIKFSGERARVSAGAAQNGGNIEIRVADEGPGIEQKHLARIFERFYRVDQASVVSLK